MRVSLEENELLEQLKAKDDEFRRLADKHQAYADQLEQIHRMVHPTEDDLLLETTLKKKKLLLKDKMYSIVQRYRKDLQGQN